MRVYARIRHLLRHMAPLTIHFTDRVIASTAGIQTAYLLGRCFKWFYYMATIDILVY